MGVSYQNDSLLIKYLSFLLKSHPANLSAFTICPKTFKSFFTGRNKAKSLFILVMKHNLNQSNIPSSPCQKQTTNTCLLKVSKFFLSWHNELKRLITQRSHCRKARYYFSRNSQTTTFFHPLLSFLLLKYEEEEICPFGDIWISFQRFINSSFHNNPSPQTPYSKNIYSLEYLYDFQSRMICLTSVIL